MCCKLATPLNTLIDCKRYVSIAYLYLYLRLILISKGYAMCHGGVWGYVYTAYTFCVAFECKLDKVALL